MYCRPWFFVWYVSTDRDWLLYVIRLMICVLMITLQCMCVCSYSHTGFSFQNRQGVACPHVICVRTHYSLLSFQSIFTYICAIWIQSTRATIFFAKFHFFSPEKLKPKALQVHWNFQFVATTVLMFMFIPTTLIDLCT